MATHPKVSLFGNARQFLDGMLNIFTVARREGNPIVYDTAPFWCIRGVP
jgi:hypothetical protein